MFTLEWVLLGFRILATVVLYTFLGMVFYIMWQDLKQVQAGTADPVEAVHQLRVIASAGDERLAVGDALPLQPITLLGRDPNNTIVLTDASVSTRHARLSRIDGGWWLEDLGSRNGTFLNDLPLSRLTPLADGDVIGIGALRFRLETVD